jgi:hypothetical protein
VSPETVIVFRVHKSNPPRMEEENWFTMTLERCKSGLWKITWIGDADRRTHYAAAGIPDALIPEASRVLRASICSSSNIHREAPNEWRTPDAETMWKRLMTRGLARYLPGDDRYVCDTAET